MQDIKEFLENLPTELKAKLAGCETQEEALALMEENGIELPEDVLDEVSGGIWWLRVHD